MYFSDSNVTVINYRHKTGAKSVLGIHFALVIVFKQQK